MNTKQLNMALEIINDVRQISFRLTTFRERMQNHQKQINQLTKDFKEVQSLNTRFKNHSNHLSQTLNKMKSITER